MVRCFRVSRRVAVGRIVAAQRHTTGLARAQMHPAGPGFDTFFAFVLLRAAHRVDGIEVLASSIV